jgi:hypothetical protein
LFPGGLSLAAAALAVLLAAAPAAAQPPRTPDAEEQAFLDALRRSDPVGYERFTALRAERDRRQAEVQRLQQQMRTAGELRTVVLPQLKAARRKWADSAIALLDFLDERDRKALAEYQTAVAQITSILDQRRQARDELEKALRSE